MQTGLEQIPPTDRRPVQRGILDSQIPDYVWFKRLSLALFPYSLSKYPGRRLGMALLLGISVSSYASMRKPAGNAVFRLPQIRRAEKIVAGLISELTGILDGLRKRREALELSRVGKSRGMLDVRVREPGGIPRNALWKGGRPKNLPPF